MKNELEDIKNEVEKTIKEQNSAYQLAISAMDKNYKREKFIVKILFVIILGLLAINGYFAYVFTTTTVLETTTTTTTEQQGLYNFYDSEGNMVTSDLSLEEMQELIDLNKGLEDGEH